MNGSAFHDPLAFIEEMKIDELRNFARRQATDLRTGLLTLDALKIALSMRTDYPLQLVTVDIVNLHGINNSHGREVGNLYIAAVGRTLLRAASTDDIASRLGGDEFGLITHPESANERMDVIRGYAHAEKDALSARGYTPLDIRCGLVAVPNGNVATIDEAVNKAIDKSYEIRPGTSRC